MLRGMNTPNLSDSIDTLNWDNVSIVLQLEGPSIQNVSAY